MCISWNNKSVFAELRIYYVANPPVAKPGQSRQKMNPEVQLQNYSYIHETFCQTNVHAKHGHFRRFRIQSGKAVISFVMSGSPFVCSLYQLVPHWKDFSKILYWRLLLKCFGKNQILLKSDIYIRHFRRKYVLLLPTTKICHKITLIE